VQAVQDEMWSQTGGLCSAWHILTRDEHGSGLDGTGSRLKPIFARSGLDRTAIFLKIGG